MVGPFRVLDLVSGGQRYVDVHRLLVPTRVRSVRLRQRRLGGIYPAHVRLGGMMWLVLHAPVDSAPRSHSRRRPCPRRNGAGRVGGPSIAGTGCHRSPGPVGEVGCRRSGTTGRTVAATSRCRCPRDRDWRLVLRSRRRRTQRRGRCLGGIRRPRRSPRRSSSC